MKFFATVAAIVFAVTTAQETLTTSGIKVISGSSPQKIMPSTSSGVSVSSVAVPQPAAFDVRLGTSDVLNRGVGLVNKNTIATDNNVYITNSNLLFRQSDQIALARKVESFVLSEAAAGADASTMSSNVMRIVSSAGGSDVTMAKASGVNVGVISDKAQAVVAAAQSGSTSDLRQRIMDLVSSAMGS